MWSWRSTPGCPSQWSCVAEPSKMTNSGWVGRLTGEMSGPSPKHASTPPLGFALNTDGCRNVTSWPLYQAFSIRNCPPGPAWAVPVISAAAAIVATRKMSRRIVPLPPLDWRAARLPRSEPARRPLGHPLLRGGRLDVLVEPEQVVRVVPVLDRDQPL